MHPEIVRKHAIDLVLKRMLGEMARETSTCMSQGLRCDKIKKSVWDYCDRCKASFFLSTLFPEKEEVRT